MDDTFRTAGRSAGVKEKEYVFTIHLFGGAGIGDAVDDPVIPMIAPFFDVARESIARVSFNNDNIFDAVALGGCLIDGVLQG